MGSPRLRRSIVDRTNSRNTQKHRIRVESIPKFQVSENTLRARRDAWMDASVFDRLGLPALQSWLSDYGQLRRNTDQRTAHRHAQLCLVVALLITAKLIDWRNRWSPHSRLSASALRVRG